jgi:hypothetical protein
MIEAIFSGWFLVNILAPVGLPLLGLLMLKLLPLPGPPATLRLMTTVKDGQLCWAVVAMGASTVYELWTALAAHKTIPPWGGIALAGILLVMLSAMLVAAGGAVFSTPLPTTPPAGAAAWMRHYSVFVGSAIMTVIAAITYTSTHFSIP